MGNRAEVSLSNPSLFSDVTAWKACKRADRVNTQVIDVLPEESNSKIKPPCRKSQLHQELTRLNMLKDNGFFTTKQERAQFIALRRQFRSELQSLEHEQRY